MAAETDNVLIAGAMGQGYGGLSSRQCAMCLLAIYAAGASIAQMMSGAASMGYPNLSDAQLDQCLLDVLQL